MLVAHLPSPSCHHDELGPFCLPFNTVGSLTAHTLCCTSQADFCNENLLCGLNANSILNRILIKLVWLNIKQSWFKDNSGLDGVSISSHPCESPVWSLVLRAQWTEFQILPLIPHITYSVISLSKRIQQLFFLPIEQGDQIYVVVAERLELLIFLPSDCLWKRQVSHIRHFVEMCENEITELKCKFINKAFFVNSK